MLLRGRTGQEGKAGACDSRGGRPRAGLRCGGAARRETGLATAWTLTAGATSPMTEPRPDWGSASACSGSAGTVTGRRAPVGGGQLLRASPSVSSRLQELAAGWNARETSGSASWAHVHCLSRTAAVLSGLCDFRGA